MGEEEIIDRITRINSEQYERSLLGYTFEAGDREAIQGLLDLYQKEKEKNKELEEYANWNISHLTEDIADYIDDDRIGNKSIIGELKEEREHWKDIIRINKNEKTYIDYKNY